MKKLSYTTSNATAPLLGETIGENLRKTVQKYPNNDALISVHQNYRATYKQFHQEVIHLAKSLLADGVQFRDRVGIWSPNRYEWTLVQYATAEIGAILVNLNPAYRVHELKFAINQSEISYVICPVKYKTSAYKKMLEEVGENCISLKKTVFLDTPDWENLLKKGETISDAQLEEATAKTDFDQAINIQYTSGTTGFPKGVTLSHHNVLNNGYFIARRLEYTDADRVCIPVPFYHCFGMVIGNLACTSHGACMVIPNDSFKADLTLSAVEKEKCTSLYGVPTMFIAELSLDNFKNYNLSSLRTGVMAGSTCPEEIMKRVQSEMNMKDVTVCYGMTETSPVSLQTKIGAPLKKQVATVGTVMEHLEVKIIDPETGKTQPIGKEGELCTRGYSVMLGYWNNPETTQQVIDASRWMHSGDLAVMDADGYVSISGRIKDLIIRGGENISPKSIEDFLYTHPKILDIQVIGVPSEKYGEEIMAWIKLHQNVQCTEAELLAFCKNQMAHYSVPKYWKFVNDFPMTVSGKIRKVEMREMAIKEIVSTNR
ncbi:AMP-binding protein [Lacinutrix sp. C3R15]|uniref:AMP-binding protein n=1 Tax=Flavobacteriaceae TaxID=49546 RepID=UPI001C0883D1|nr:MULTISPECIES: AMP-binding protein [Flavobacteriaceae]MBU2940784.1 AMP-binding protein [Lacinutrix sp. C3R15]MDO6624102.1 AMP-binding protein [Oceanihabitans sp. 1_MG-2023]